MMATEPRSNRSRIAAIPAAVAALALAASAAAQTVRYEAQPTGSKVKMEGTSTIHDWTVESSTIDGFIEADGKLLEATLKDPKPIKPSVQVSIPVSTLKSYAEAMDAVMQDHLNMADYPRIEYRLIELKPTFAAGAAGPLKFDAVGALTVSGTTIEWLDKARVKIAGSTPLKKTDFDIQPPAPRILGMPLIKTGDDIKISFEWLLSQKTESARTH